MDAAPVLRLYVRRSPGTPPEVAERLELRAGGGVVGDHTFGGARHVTLLFLEDWRAAAREAGVPDADPAGRRANVLLAGGDAGRWIGRRARLGGALIRVVGETRPCHVMERVAPGFLAALAPRTRAGVWAVIDEDGEVAPGDALESIE